MAKVRKKKTQNGFDIFSGKKSKAGIQKKRNPNFEVQDNAKGFTRFLVKRKKN